MEIDRPVCPHCSHDEFREDQKVGAEQEMVWNEKEKMYEWGTTKYFNEEIETVGFVCAKCEKDVDFRIFKEWIL